MEGKQLLALAITCREFGVMPSQRLGILDSTMALDLDIAAAITLRLNDPNPIIQLMKALAGTGSDAGGGVTEIV